MNRKVKGAPKLRHGTTLSSKGQVTIPKSVRYALNLRPGDRLSFVADGDRAILLPSKGDFFSLKGSLRRYFKRPLSLRAMKAAARRHVAERYRAHRHG